MFLQVADFEWLKRECKLVGVRFILALLIALPGGLCGQSNHVYVGQIESRAVLIAWGNTKGPNTIGRTSISMGNADISIAGQHVTTTKNYSFVTGLEPDRTYPYEVSVNGAKIGGGGVRTWPEHATTLCFFVMGDYGTGTTGQKEIAAAMTKEFQARASRGEVVRFVLTTGDNIYADLNLGFTAIHSGDNDADWEEKFFGPYGALLREIPFYPSPGNHDGNGTENRDDLNAYLDNFFYPHDQPARWYSFAYADLARFFSLDSTDNSASGRPHPVYTESGEEFSWFRKAIAASQAPWNIPYWHHPMFNAGPYHGASYDALKQFIPLFKQSGVKVVFSGHEHNFQFSERSAATGNIRYVITGAGGELRHGNVQGRLKAAHIEGWAAERHFLVVEIDADRMTITPIGAAGMIKPVNAAGAPVPMPLVIQR